MKELLYYTIFAIILYFLLSAVFDNFYLEQENFDPSLVPVSSIVTLAKVAQKLVNGNGIITNPTNVQIGMSSSTPANLNVNGNTTINGNLISTGPVNGLYFKNQNSNTDLYAWYAENATSSLYFYDGSNGGNKLTIDTSGNLTGTSISGLGSVHFTGFGADNWLPYNIDGQNYLRKNVIMEAKLCGNNSCDTNGTVNIKGNLSGCKITNSTMDDLVKRAYVQFAYSGTVHMNSLMNTINTMWNDLFPGSWSDNLASVSLRISGRIGSVDNFFTLNRTTGNITIPQLPHLGVIGNIL